MIQEKQHMQSRFAEALIQSQLETHETSHHQINEEMHDNIGQLLSRIECCPALQN